MPVLGEGLGHLHTETVKEQVVGIAILLEQVLGPIGDLVAHRDDVEGGVVDLFADRSEEVGDAQVRILPLPGKLNRVSSLWALTSSQMTRSSPSPFAGKYP